MLGALLVAAGAALLLDRLGALPMLWRDRIWPMLLIGYGLARMLQPRAQGRIGLFFVLAGAWWLAGVSGWISLEQTWPLLVVAIGVSMMFQAFTPADSVDLASGRTRQGGAPWILLAILVGAAVTSGIGRHTHVRNDTENGVLHVFSVIGRATSHPGPAATLKGAEVVTLIGGSTIDLHDLAVFPRVGLAVAPANAHPWTAEHVHWTTRARGGEGAARELCDVLLAAQGHVPALLQEHGA